MSQTPIQTQISQTQAKQKFLIMYDTDVHGGLSGLIALESIRKLGIDAEHFSSFAQQPPATTPSLVADTLPLLFQQYTPSDVVMLDIPIDSRNPRKFVDALSRYTYTTNNPITNSPMYIGTRILYIDHHDITPYHAELFIRSINVVMLPTSYQMSMYIPSILNITDADIEKFALIAATADYDETIADRVSTELEEDIELLDTAWKGKLREIDEVKNLSPKYGNVGAVVQYLLEKNVGPEDLLKLAREYGSPVPSIKYDIIGNIVIATDLTPQGLGWKIASKLCRITQTPIAVVITPTPQQKYAVIVAAYWRQKSKYVNVIEEVVKNVTENRVVIGHPGARSIEATGLEDAKTLATEVARKLNELIASTQPKAETIVVANIMDELRMLSTRINMLVDRFNNFLDMFSKVVDIDVNLLEKLRTIAAALEQYYYVTQDRKDSQDEEDSDD